MQADMDDAEAEISRSTPNYRLSPPAAPAA
jgi:hypothetical protein